MSAILIMRIKRGCLHCDIGLLLWHSELLGLHLSTSSFVISETIYARNAGWFIPSTCRACRAHSEECVVLVVRVAPCLFQHGRQRRSSSCSRVQVVFLCSGFAAISAIGTTSGQSEVDVSTPVHAVATPFFEHVSCVSRRVSRQAWHVRLVTSIPDFSLIPMPKRTG